LEIRQPVQWKIGKWKNRNPPNRQTEISQDENLPDYYI